MDVDFIMAKQLKQMEKELREKDTKLRTQEKKASLPQLYPTPPPLVHTCNILMSVYTSMLHFSD